VIESDVGIVLRLEGASFYTNTQVYHNTVYYIRGVTGSTVNAALSVSDCTTSDTNFVIQNNIFTVGSSQLTSSFGYRFGANQSPNMVISNNYFDGQSYQELNETGQIIPLGSTTEASIFVNPTTAIPGADFMCQGLLLSAGASNTGVTDDFDTNTRPAITPDIGCYQHNSGPHWAINANFKDSSGPPVYGTSLGTSTNSIASRSQRPVFLEALLQQMKLVH